MATLRFLVMRISYLPSAPVGADLWPSAVTVAPASGAPLLASLMMPVTFTVMFDGGATARWRLVVCAPSGSTAKVVAARATLKRVRREAKVMRNLLRDVGSFDAAGRPQVSIMVDHGLYG